MATPAPRSRSWSQVPGHLLSRMSQVRVLPGVLLTSPLLAVSRRMHAGSRPDRRSGGTARKGEERQPVRGSWLRDGYIRIGLLLALTAIVALAFAASGARSSSRASCHPVLIHVDGAKHRAERGWDADEVRTRPKAQARVREQARCVPEGKPERFVRHKIEVARNRYKAGVLNAEVPWPPAEELPDYAYLHGVALCESGDTNATSNPTYRGYLQFSFSTWASVGGSGDPVAASRDEQYYRGQLLLNSAGSGSWPVCG